MQGCKSVRKTMKDEENWIYRFDYGGYQEHVRSYQHSSAFEHGFSVDIENDVYVKDGYGAFSCNVDKKYKTIEDLKKEGNKLFLFQGFLKFGWEFVLGPAFPSSDGKINPNYVGLYCKNYLEMVQKRKRLEEEYNEIKTI